MTKLRFVLLVLCLGVFFNTILYAQKPSERRKQYLEQEELNIKQGASNKVSNRISPTELKNIKLEKEEIQKGLFGLENGMDVFESPAVFKNNSAVILSQVISYRFYTDQFDGLHLFRFLRKRILIQDKSALENFSILYSNSNAVYTVNVIKKDRKSVVISKLAEEIETAGITKIPDVYTDLVGSGEYCTKLPIQGLEIGDIIDIRQKVQFGITYTPLAVKSYPILGVFCDDYPVVFQRYAITVPPNYSIFAHTINNSPKPQIEVRPDGYRVFTFEDSIRNTFKEEYFDRPNKNLAYFKVVLLKKPPLKLTYLDDKIDTNLSPISIVELAKHETIEDKKQAEDLKNSTLDYLKLLAIKPENKTELINKAYYYLRTTTLAILHEKELAKALKDTSTHKKNEEQVIMNEDLFFNVFVGVLNGLSINYESIASVSKNYCEIDKVCHPAEIRKGLKVFAEKPVYIFYFNQNSLPNEIPAELQGSQALFYPSPQSTIDLCKDIKLAPLPESSLEDNYTKEISTIKLDANFENVLLKKHILAKGMPKYDYYDKVLFKGELVKNDLHKVGRGNDSTTTTNLIQKEQEEKEWKNGMENLKEMFEDQKFEVEKVSDFELVSDGRYDESPILEFKINTEFKNLIAQAGPNYLVSVGTLIGSQLELKPEDMKRDFDIYQNYSRHFVDEMNFEIPEGYTVEDPNSLKMNVDNESASFLAEAEVKGNQLHIKTTKTYKNQFDPKSKWENYTKVLEAAYEFHQKKIVLKKKG
ncbi:MAG: hypothetical protein CFE21_10280 [Bacteroidetes bacterium B1(2017)]|nr:MAG: hypothetical protein CFE21_10280 [Bacteroidetes bacterium B1(2017)]